MTRINEFALRRPINIYGNIEGDLSWRKQPLEPHSLRALRSHLVGSWLERHGDMGSEVGHEPPEFDAQEQRNRRAFPHPAGGPDQGLPLAWKEAGHEREPRVSVSRSIVAIVDDRDRTYFGRGREDDGQIGFIDPRTEAIFGRSYAAEPGVLIEQIKKDEAIVEADTLLLTVPNQLGVACNTHVI